MGPGHGQLRKHLRHVSVRRDFRFGRAFCANPNGLCGPNGEYRRQSFVVALWPYLEQINLYQQYDFNYTFYSSRNTGPVNVAVPVYFCPSDRQGKAGGGNPRYRGNYVTNWGYSDFDQDPNALPKPDGTNPMKIGPFGPNRVTRVAEIRDGLSTTMFMSEVIQAISDDASYGWDFRGDFFNNDTGAAQFMTYYTPNSGIDSMPTCSSIPTPNDPSPCQSGEWVYMSARSKHPGGAINRLRRRLGYVCVQFHRSERMAGARLDGRK